MVYALQIKKGLAAKLSEFLNGLSEDSTVFYFQVDIILKRALR